MAASKYRVATTRVPAAVAPTTQVSPGGIRCVIPRKVTASSPTGSKNAIPQPHARPRKGMARHVRYRRSTHQLPRRSTWPPANTAGFQSRSSPRGSGETLWSTKSGTWASIANRSRSGALVMTTDAPPLGAPKLSGSGITARELSVSVAGPRGAGRAEDAARGLALDERRGRSEVRAGSEELSGADGRRGPSPAHPMAVEPTTSPASTTTSDRLQRSRSRGRHRMPTRMVHTSSGNRRLGAAAGDGVGRAG